MAQVAATDAGTTPGALSVSRTGGATYSVPVEVPPGVGQVTPELALTFNSQAGNGLAGWGWNISGLSSITRIAPTTYHDGIKESVNFTVTDRFALDGQRLMATSGTYGGDGTVYGTENYSNIKVISYGTSSYGSTYGPSYFIVYYPDGSRSWYGRSAATSRVEWAIEKWEDPQANSIGYQYITDVGLLRIDKITYGSRGGASAPNNIKFNYEKRARPENTFIVGHIFKRDYILDNIEVSSSGSLFRKYKLAHKTNSLGYQTISAVQESNGLGGTLEPIMFTYGDTSDGIETVTDYSSSKIFPGITSLNSETLSGDFNGDGSIDLISYYSDDKTGINVFTDLAKGSNLKLGWKISTGDFESIISGPILSHNGKILAGQGITMINETSGGNSNRSNVTFKTFAMAATGAVFQYNKTWSAPKTREELVDCRDEYYNVIQKKYVSGDFNGDGLLDVLALTLPYSDFSCRETPDCSDSGALDCCECIDIRKLNSEVHFIDLDRSKPSGFSNSAGSLNAQLKYDDRLIAGDFTGNGKTDLLHVKTGNVYLYSLDENNTLRQVAHRADSGLRTDYPLLVGDYNGDGMMDIATPVAESNPNWLFFLYNGSFLYRNQRTIADINFRKNFVTEYNEYERNYIAQDFNGDGKTDIMSHDITTSLSTGNVSETFKIFTSASAQGPTPNFVRTVQESFGSTGTKKYGLPIVLDARYTNRNLEYGYISGNTLRVYEFLKDNRKDMTLETISNNGITTAIDYHPLSPYSDDYYFDSPYSNDLSENYPYVNVNNAPGMLLVKHLEETGSGIVRKQDFFYKGAVMHAEGLGFLGFKVMYRSNWYGDNVGTLWSSSKQDPQKRGATVDEWTANFRSDTPSNYAARTTYDYTTTITNDGVFINVPKTTVAHDALKDVTTSRSYVYNNYYSPTRITTINTAGSTLEEYTYSNNASAKSQFYHIGRPTVKKSTSVMDGNSFFAQEEYSYSNNLMTSLKKKGSGTDYVTESFVHDVFGNVTRKRISAPGMSTRSENFIYTNDGRFLETEENIQGQTAYYLTDDNGNIMSINNFMGRPTGFEYDGWNRLIKETDYLGKSVSFSYENISGGGLRTFSDYQQGQDTYEYQNAFGWTYLTNTLTLNGQWIKKSYRYDAAGRMTQASEPYWANASANQWNVTVFDEFGRVIEKRAYTGRTTTINYSGLSTTVDDGTKIRTITNDAAGNLKTLQDPGGTIAYSYFGNGAMREADYGGQKTTVTIDGWGRRSQLVDPSAGTYTYEYNLYGELTKETSPKGETGYQYDGAGKILRKTIVGDETDLQLDYTYNTYYEQLSTITGRDDKNGKYYNYSFEYDSRRRPSKVTEDSDEVNFWKEMTYDSYGRPSRETYFTSQKTGSGIASVRTRNVYDTGSGMFKEILDGNTSASLWKLNEHDARGQATSIAYGNGFERTSQFDAYGLPENVNVTNDGGSMVSHALRLGYSFNARRGTLDSRENFELDWEETFTHDNLDRLTGISGSVTRNQSYDALGRIDENSEIGSYGYDGTNKYRLAELGLNAKGQSFYSTGATQRVTYNAFKKPVEINAEGKGRASFEYSVMGNRSHAWYGGNDEDKNERRYHKQYSAIMPVELVEDKQTGNVKILTYIGGNGYSAPIVHIKTTDTHLNGYHYLHRDYLGSILAITDSSGTVKEQRQFGAWGAVDKFIDNDGGTAFSHGSILDRGYTGHEHFFDLGLIHMNGRMYDPQMGRFLSPDNFVQDPFNTQNYNRYGYVMNNPLLYTDRSGEFAEAAAAAIYWVGAVVVASIASSWNWLNDQGVFRGVNKWFNKNIKGPIDKAFDWLHGRNKKGAPDAAVESPPASVSIDPLVRPSFGVVPILTGNGSGGLADAMAWQHNFNVGALRGFIAGAESSWDFIKGLTTTQGWVGLGQGVATLAEIGDLYSANGMMLRAQMAQGTSDFVARVPSMSPGELGYYAGYASEKIVEGVLLSKGAGLAGNAAKSSSSFVQFSSKIGKSPAGNRIFSFQTRFPKSNLNVRLDRGFRSPLKGTSRFPYLGKPYNGFNTHINIQKSGSFNYHVPLNPLKWKYYEIP